MHVGDQVKLHIDPAHQAALDLPEGVGTIRALDTTPLVPAILIHFEDMSVYTSAVREAEIEVIGQKPRPIPA